MCRRDQLIAAALKRAAEGVDFSSRHGALCPLCGQKLAITVTKPWVGSVRIRFHRCYNKQCLLCAAETSMKSVQQDHSEHS